jgi:hypothetical protein
VVVLEYASKGRVVLTGAPYANRYISVLTITDRKVTHWRDYLDPVAVFDASDGRRRARPLGETLLAPEIASGRRGRF